MRTMSTPQRYFDFSQLSSQKVVSTYQRKYLLISDLLDQNTDLLQHAHQDWVHLLSTSTKGRQSSYTSEHLLRALIVKCLEQESYRDTVIRIETSEFLRNFVRLGNTSVMGFSLLSEAFCLLSDQTLQVMNQSLNTYALSEDKISPDMQRLDSTVYETHIHYPTDSSLLWDSFRILARLLSDIRSGFPDLSIQHRFHVKKIKKLYTYLYWPILSTNVSHYDEELSRGMIPMERTLHGTAI